MIETKVEGRPALVTLLNAKFEPVNDEADAVMLVVVFTDERGGKIVLTPAKTED